MASRFRPAVSRPDPRDRRILIRLVLGATLLYAVAIILRLQAKPMGDEPHYLILTQAIARYGTVDPTAVYQHHDYWQYYPEQIDAHTILGPDGHTAPLHGIGGPLLFLLPFLLFGRLGAHLVILAAAALTVGNIYQLLRERGSTVENARLTTILVVLGTPLYVYASMLYIEPLAILGVTYALRVVLAPEPARSWRGSDTAGEQPLATAPRNPTWRILLAATALGYLPWLHGRFVLFTVILGGALAWRYRHRWYALLPLPALLIGVEAFSWYHYATLNPAGGNASAGEGLLHLQPHLGLLFLLLDGRFGLLANFPVLILAGTGVLLTIRRREDLILLSTAGTYLLALTTFPNWHAGFSPPARLLASLTPILACYLATALQHTNQRLINAGAALATGYAFLLTFITDLVPTARFHRVDVAIDLPVDFLTTLTHLPLTSLLPLTTNAHHISPGQTPRYLAWAITVTAISVAARYMTTPNIHPRPANRP